MYGVELQRQADLLDTHALAEIGLDPPSDHARAPVEHECGGDGHAPAIIPVDLAEIESLVSHQLPHLVTEPKRKVERKDELIVDVRQDGQSSSDIGWEASDELLPIRHDRNDLRA